MAALLLPLWIHKTLVWPLLPIGMTLILVLAGIVLKRRWLCGAGAAVLVLLSAPVTSNVLMRGLESAYPPIAPAQCQPADAAVVLGGGASEGMRPGSVDWNEAADRFAGGVELFQTGRVQNLIFTRGKMPWSDARDEGSLLREEAMRRGIQDARILLTHGDAGNTADEAREVARLVNERGWKRLVVVTSAFHMRRAMRLFEGAAPHVSAYPVDYRSHKRIGREWTDWMLRADALKDTEEAMKEFWGLAWYGMTCR